MNRLSYQGLQNLLSNRNNVSDLIDVCFTPLLRMLRECDDGGAVQCFFNIATVPECEEQWLNNKTHIKLLECMCVTNNTNAKASYLPVLVQMATNHQCVIELLKDDVISKIEKKVVGVVNKTGLRDTAKLLLAIMNTQGNFL